MMKTFISDKLQIDGSNNCKNNNVQTLQYRFFPFFAEIAS